MMFTIMELKLLYKHTHVLISLSFLSGVEIAEIARYSQQRAAGEGRNSAQPRHIRGRRGLSLRVSWWPYLQAHTSVLLHTLCAQPPYFV